jgi:hypothetical protein
MSRLVAWGVTNRIHKYIHMYRPLMISDFFQISVSKLIFNKISEIDLHFTTFNSIGQYVFHVSKQGFHGDYGNRGCGVFKQRVKN